MSKVFEAYAQRKGIAVKSVRFFLDGQRVDEGQTPAEVGIEEGEQLDAMLEQTGGL